jgi:hypothetical protein
MELAALEKLLEFRKAGLCLMYRSRVVRSELEMTPSPERRSKLQADYEALDQIPVDERVLFINKVSDHLGGHINNALTSDVLDERHYEELKASGLTDEDAHHLSHAACNDCDVFLTRDEATIIQPHREWLEQKFPGFRVRLPSELVAEMGLSLRQFID